MLLSILPEPRRFMTHKIGEHMTEELATSVIESQTLKKTEKMIIHKVQSVLIDIFGGTIMSVFH